MAVRAPARELLPMKWIRSRGISGSKPIRTACSTSRDWPKFPAINISSTSEKDKSALASKMREPANKAALSRIRLSMSPWRRVRFSPIAVSLAGAIRTSGLPPVTNSMTVLQRRLAMLWAPGQWDQGTLPGPFSGTKLSRWAARSRSARTRT